MGRKKSVATGEEAPTTPSPFTAPGPNPAATDGETPAVVVGTPGPDAEEAPTATTEEADKVMASGAEVKALLKEWHQAGKDDKNALVKHLEATYPGLYTEEKWRAGIGNALTQLRKAGELPEGRGRGRPRGGTSESPTPSPPSVKREPTASDLRAVHSYLSDNKLAIGDLREKIAEIEELAGKVGGLPQLSECLSTLESFLP